MIIKESDWKNIALDIAGLIPGIGEAADFANALLHAKEGEYLEAGLSIISLLPAAGDVLGKSIKALRYVSKSKNSNKLILKNINLIDDKFKAFLSSDFFTKELPSYIRRAKDFIEQNEDSINKILDFIENYSDNETNIKNSKDDNLFDKEQEIEDSLLSNVNSQFKSTVLALSRYIPEIRKALDLFVNDTDDLIRRMEDRAIVKEYFDIIIREAVSRASYEKEFNDIEHALSNAYNSNAPQELIDDLETRAEDILLKLEDQYFDDIEEDDHSGTNEDNVFDYYGLDLELSNVYAMYIKGQIDEDILRERLEGIVHDYSFYLSDINNLDKDVLNDYEFVKNLAKEAYENKINFRSKIRGN